MVQFENLKAGDAIPAITSPAISHLQLALYASAGADHNPIHVDEDAAKAGGLPGIIAHGMLPLGFLGRLITQWAPQRQLRSLSARFVAMAFPGDVITCSGKIAGKREEAGEKLVDLELVAQNQKGENIQLGKATVVLN
ncbi:MAG: MaoC/PaaZ C-terminal domain-containing protein [Proteobacteria bacterium]|nr:MaoC/PaaZ C-terminal domain-containing protein [Pseudomonadota bacterium]